MPDDTAAVAGLQGKWDQYAEWWSPFAAYYPVSYAVGDQDVEGQGEAPIIISSPLGQDWPP